MQWNQSNLPNLDVEIHTFLNTQLTFKGSKNVDIWPLTRAAMRFPPRYKIHSFYRVTGMLICVPSSIAPSEHSATLLRESPVGLRYHQKARLANWTSTRAGISTAATSWRNRGVDMARGVGCSAFHDSPAAIYESSLAHSTFRNSSYQEICRRLQYQSWETTHWRNLFTSSLHLPPKWSGSLSRTVPLGLAWHASSASVSVWGAPAKISRRHQNIVREHDNMKTTSTLRLQLGNEPLKLTTKSASSCLDVHLTQGRCRLRCSFR